MTPFIPWIIGAYLAGTIPFGLLIGLARGVDIREHGSGNIGATNVARVLGRRIGVLCFVLDFLKGFAPTLAAGFAFHSAGICLLPATTAWGWLLVAGAAVLGHVFPVWLRFKGGKGVATSLGAMAAVYPILTSAVAGAAVVWVATAVISRYVSLSSCLAAISIPLFVIIRPLVQIPGEFGPPEDLTQLLVFVLRVYWPFVVATAAVAGLVLWTHRGNIARLRTGTEYRIGQRRPEHPDPPSTGPTAPPAAPTPGPDSQGP